MSFGYDPLINCPRTGIPCPFLLECVTDEQASLDKIEETRTQYLEAATSGAVFQAETEIYTELTAGIAHARGIQDVRARLDQRQAANTGLEDALGKVIESHQQLADINRKGAQMARMTCIGGPWILRRHIVRGEKAVRCVSLIALLSKE